MIHLYDRGYFGYERVESKVKKLRVLRKSAEDAKCGKEVEAPPSLEAQELSASVQGPAFHQCVATHEEQGAGPPQSQ